MPAPHLMVALKKGERPRGTPRDGGEVLFGYKDSWACTIHNIIEHKHVVRLLRRQASCLVTKTWDLDLECEEVKVTVKNSGLWPVVESSNIDHDRVAVSAFCERFYGETNTMLFSFGEIAIIPDDAHQILGLEVVGKAVCEGFDYDFSFKDIYKLSQKIFGCNQIERSLCLRRKTVV
ncbi:hypothetical protein C5167_016629 [Papaver somniferum]|nr:hypothetical protein C5167_016629 [Papaver somniferum]